MAVDLMELVLVLGGVEFGGVGVDGEGRGDAVEDGAGEDGGTDVLTCVDVLSCVDGLTCVDVLPCAVVLPCAESGVDEGADDTSAVATDVEPGAAGTRTTDDDDGAAVIGATTDSTVTVTCGPASVALEQAAIDDRVSAPTSAASLVLNARPSTLHRGEQTIAQGRHHRD